MAGKIGGTLTVAVIARDEEDYIYRCLESAKNIADEVVVVDTGSRDSTIEICMCMGITPHRYVWDGNYSNARNAAARQATSEWILMVDADERVVVNRDIRELLRHTSKEMGAFQVAVRSPSTRLTGETAIEEYWLLRLYRNNYGIEYSGYMHESIGKNVMSINLRAGKTGDIEIVHLGYDIPQTDFRAFLSQRTKKHVDYLKENPYDGMMWYHLGKLYELWYRPQMAYESFKKAIETKNLTTSFELELRVYLAGIYEQRYKEGKR